MKNQVDRVDLQGKWNYELDYLDKGIEEKWYERTLIKEGFSIPGTTASNKVGKKVEIERALTKESVKCLREEYKYLGACFYQTTFKLDKSFKNKRVFLFLERVLFESTLWIDGNLVGKQDSLSTPHEYDITEYIKYEEQHILTIRIDNRDIQNIGPYSSSYTDETQTIWNGLIGKVEILGKEAVYISNSLIGVEISKKKIKCKTVIINSLDCEIKSDLTISIIDPNSSEKIILQQVYPLEIAKGNNEIEIFVPLCENIRLWDEFKPYTYDFEMKLDYMVNGYKVESSWGKKLGFREITAIEGKILINGLQRFLRGTIDCCIYPLTGYPPMEEIEWDRIFEIVKNYGLNHVRFHSWCPPEAAFQAADKQGIYLQVEGPVWMDNWTKYAVGSYKEHYTYLPKEACKIVENYAMHPSFCIFSNGNELNGDFTLLHNIIKKVRAIHPYILYTLTSNWDRTADSEDDIFIAQTIDGIGIRGQYFLDKMAEATNLQFDQGVEKRNIPIISHEVGQYVVYPNVAELPKFTGVLKATNFEAIKEDLTKKNLLHFLPQYVKASGKLAALLYKAEIEAALRTKDLGGIQLLGLHDFPGQSTATIGLLDCFWDSKNIIETKYFKGFCNPVVPLIKMPKYIYTTRDLFKATLEVTYFGNTPGLPLEIEVFVEDAAHNIIFKEELKAECLEIGINRDIAKIEVKLFENIVEPTALKVKVGITSIGIWNSWDIWVYPELKGETFDEKNIYETLTEDAISRLDLGESVVILANPKYINNAQPGKFFPVFWSPVHFVSKDPCGMYINNKHPLFKNYFPTDDYASYQWKDMLENSVSICIDDIDSLIPLTMPIPNFFNNHKLTNLFEAKVLNGKLLVCSIDLNNDLEHRIEALNFKKALLKYVNSNYFNPTNELDVECIKKLFKVLKEINIVQRRNVALNKKAWADNEKSLSYNAQKANNGNPSSCWCAADGDTGHFWQVDLGETYDITGVKIIFNEEGNYLYVIHTSIDGEKWILAINQTGQIKTDKERIDNFTEKAKYIRITYNGLPNGICAGHIELEAYID